MGTPRTDVQVTATDERRRQVRARLQGSGVRVGDDRRVVLVAPTWRGEAFADPRLDVDGLVTLVTSLRHVWEHPSFPKGV